MKISRRPVLHGGQPRWRVFWTQQRRGRKRFFRSRREAEDFLDELRREKAEMGAAWTALGELERVELITAYRRAKKAGYGLGAALDFYERAHAAPVAGELTVGALFDEFLEAKRQGNLRARSVAALKSTLDQFRAVHGDVLAKTIRPEHVAAFLQREDWQPRTRMGARANLSGAFGWATRREHINKNPVEGVDRPKFDALAVVLLSSAEAEALLRIAERDDPELLGALALACFAGLRPESEIGRLNRAAVERAVEVGTLEIVGGKVRSKRRREIPVRPNLQEWIRRWLVLGVEIQPPDFKRRLARVRALAGWGGARPWTPDTPRHSFASATRMLLGGVVSSRQCGHSEAVSDAHYNGKLTMAEAVAWFEIWPDATADYAGRAVARAAAMAENAGPSRMSALARRRWGQPAA